MVKVYHLIILCILLKKGMVTFDGNSHVDLVFLKALRYIHHRENYKESLQNGVIPPGLRKRNNECLYRQQKIFISNGIRYYMTQKGS